MAVTMESMPIDDSTRAALTRSSTGPRPDLLFDAAMRRVDRVLDRCADAHLDTERWEGLADALKDRLDRVQKEVARARLRERLREIRSLVAAGKDPHKAHPPGPFVQIAVAAGIDVTSAMDLYRRAAEDRESLTMAVQRAARDADAPDTGPAGSTTSDNPKTSD